MNFIKMDEYTIKARFYPAILTSIPFVLLNSFLPDKNIAIISKLLNSVILQNVSILIILIFLLMETNRYVSKFILEKLFFNEELYMPTTNILLFKDEIYSDNFKKKIHRKVNKDFKISLLSQKQEKQNEILARKKICEAIALIREKVKKGRLVLQHNIHYGFTRNLIGGSFIGALVSLLDIWIFSFKNQNNFALIISIFCFLAFMGLIFFRKKLMQDQGRAYAKKLIQEYLLV